MRVTFFHAIVQGETPLHAQNQVRKAKVIGTVTV